MVSIVVVAHSHALATAAVELARQMGQGREVPVAVAAGLDETTLGTDAIRIRDAIENVDSPDGVLVLMDLGSAVLSTETALELVDPPVRERTALCPGPLVEGLIVALVAAAGGATLAEVSEEAAAALSGKQSHLAPATSAEPAAVPGAGPEAGPQAPPSAATPAVTGGFVVTGEHGLHARPAARLVSEVRTLDARVTLRNLSTGQGPVSATSLSKVATLGARQGHELEVSAEGPQAQQAVDLVLTLTAADAAAEAAGAARAAAGAGAGGAEPGESAEAPTGPLGASPGVGVGPAWRPAAGTPPVPERAAGDPDDEWRRLTDATAQVRRDTAQLRERTSRAAGEDEAAIFEAHLLLLDDDDLLDRVRRDIDDGRTAEAAWAAAVGSLEARMSALDDAYQRARAADARAVGDQVLRALLGVAEGFESRAGVLVAAEVTPADVSRLDPDLVTGVLLAHGSPTSHAAILARSMAVPMVVGAGAQVLTVVDGTTIALDGGTGEFVVDPNSVTRERYRARAHQRQRLQREARASAGQPARTRDGVEVQVAANLGSVADAQRARAAGADAAGLVRTEFLFLDRAEAPGVAEQERTYRAIAQALEGRRVTLRTLDVGGDKPLPYLPAPRETNPFLGLRGIRLSLRRAELLRDQLLAACRVARDAPVSIMFPMVSTPQELHAALEVLDRAVAADGGDRPAGLSVGIMVEVPAAALKAAAFLPAVDFFSIGTNDLTQYALAAERGNDAVAALADPLDPGVLRLVDAVCRAAAGRVPVAVCGEAAADDAAVPLLLGLGVRELSVVPPAVPTVKQVVRSVDSNEAARVAAAALEAAGAEQVRASVPRVAPPE